MEHLHQLYLAIWMVTPTEHSAPSGDMKAKSYLWLQLMHRREMHQL